MFIKYECPNCGKVRTFTVAKKDVKCDECKVLLRRNLTNISIDSYSTEESRFMNDEAMFGTIGKRVDEKRFEVEEEDGSTQQ